MEHSCESLRSGLFGALAFLMFRVFSTNSNLAVSVKLFFVLSADLKVYTKLSNTAGGMRQIKNAFMHALYSCKRVKFVSKETRQI